MIVGSDLTRGRLVSRSVGVIGTHQSPSGAYPASPTFSAYKGYAWLRDGAFIAEGMSRCGGAAGASAFHVWCARVISARAARVTELLARARRGDPLPPGAMLPTRFTLDGDDGADAWWDHQLDGYGTWLWALAEHTARHGTPVPAEAVRVAARYLSAFWDVPCYDWWEEHVDRRHVSTLGAIHAGLRAALALDVLDPADERAARDAVAGVAALVAERGVAPAGHLRKWLDESPQEPTNSDGLTGYGPTGSAPSEGSTGSGPGDGLSDGLSGSAPSDGLPRPALAESGNGLADYAAANLADPRLGGDAVDASLLACVHPFGLYPPDHPVAISTVAEVGRRLENGGGVHRFLADTFYGGGRWILLAGFLGLNHAVAGRRDEALRQLDWMAAQASEAGELPEQVSDVLLAPGRRQEWVDRWGEVARPLLWSHGMYLMLAAELGVKPAHPEETA